MSTAEFADQLDNYLAEIESADNEAQRAQYFIEFLRRDLNVGEDFIGHPTRIRPELEESLKTTQSGNNRSLSDFVESEDADESSADEEQKTVLIRGRLDARVGNLIMEFKDDLSADIDDAKSQLRKYVYILYNETPEDDFVCFASDGKMFVPFEATISNGVDSEDDVHLRELCNELDLAKENPESVKRWFRSFVNDRVNPTVDSIDEWFGIDSEIYDSCMSIIGSAYDETITSEVHYDEWQSYLQYAQGQTLEEVESKDLFFRHTYLASFSKLLTYMVIVRGSVPSTEYASEILEGIVGEPLPKNLFDEDLFSWIGQSPQSDVLCETLIDGLIEFNLGKVDQDIFKQLYQEMVSPEVRHDLGEYYTPDWLADYMTSGLEISDGQKVLDPSCGSGTFLIESIHKKRENSDRTETEFLNAVQNEVVGIDVHPLAIATAKANYIASIQDLLQYRRDDFFVPIYLADSAFLQLMEEGDDDDSPTPTVGGVPVTEMIEVGGEEYRLPFNILDSPSELDTGLDLVQEYVHEPEELEYKLPDSLEEYRHLFEDIREKMERAKNDGRDTIHAYILKNFYRPLYLADSEFDLVVGNPPFLSYRFMSDSQQTEMKEIMEGYNISPGSENITQMDLAALFVMRCTDLYLTDGGQLAFVMPRGIFNGAQHEPFRRGDYVGTFDITRVLDLNDVDPLFNIDACAIFIQNGEELGYPILKENIKGELTEQNESLEQYADGSITTSGGTLSIERGEISLDEGETTSWEELVAELERSPYYADFSDGATLYPRSFVLAELIPEVDEFGYDESQPSLRTAYRPRVNTSDDSPYSVVVEADVEQDFIYGTLLGGDVVRFAHRPIRPCVLPTIRSSSGYDVITERQADNGPFSGLADWLGQCNQHWDESDDRATISEQFNYRSKIEKQNPDADYYVVYLKDGTNIAAAVVNVESAIEETQLKVNNVIIDHELFYHDTDSRDEAYYLSAILNSSVVNTVIKPLQSTGDFGPRHIHKLPLEFPIPEFDPKDELHLRLAELAEQAEQKALEALPSLVEQYEPDKKPTNSRWLREKTNDEVAAELEEVNQLVEDIL